MQLKRSGFILNETKLARKVKMKQPELGRKLAFLRQEKNLTQEELVDACNVSVRTLQRIEAGEVTPRTSTIKIILTALDTQLEKFDIAEETSNSLAGYSSVVRLGWVAGIIYLVIGIIEMVLDLERIELEAMGILPDELGEDLSIPLYIGVKVTSFVSYACLVIGISAVATIFNNYLLRIAAWLMVAAYFAVSLVDIGTLYFYLGDTETMILLSGVSIIMGGVGIVFGVGLFKLQDGMGRAALGAGILEFIIGAFYVTVVLFFISYLLTVPAIILEIILLFKAETYIRKESTQIG